MSKFSGIVHYIEDNLIFASKGTQIYVSYDKGNKWEFLFKIPLPLPLKIRSAFKLSRRLFRADVHHIVRSDKNTLVLMAFGAIYTYNLKTRRLNPEITNICDSRSLNLCSANKARLFYGEYCNNKKRNPVHIFGSEDGGKHWEPIFQLSGVRHIHGVFFDEYTNNLWVTTGDRDEESGIWVSDDRFRSLDMVAGGNQQLRSVQLLFSDNDIYFGSDSPLEKNYLYKMERSTGRIEKLQEVEGSVFWGCKVKNHLFFSTVVEPSKVNKSKYACIWGAKDGEKWRCITRFRKDIWPKKLFQYGQLLFPSGDNNSNYLYFTPFGTESHLAIQKYDVISAE